MGVPPGFTPHSSNAVHDFIYRDLALKAPKGWIRPGRLPSSSKEPPGPRRAAQRIGPTNAEWLERMTDQHPAVSGKLLSCTEYRYQKGINYQGRLTNSIV